MKLEHKLQRHPFRYQLMAWAESHVNPGIPVPAAIAAHLAECPECAEEAREMRASLEFVALAPALEPSEELTSSILLHAKATRKAVAREARRNAAPMAALRGLGYAAALFLVTGLVFGAVLGNPARETGQTEIQLTHAPMMITEEADPGVSPESIRKANAEVRTLSAAVQVAARKQTQPPEIQQQIRNVSALDVDIAAAIKALERNPGCVRATHIVHANLKRQAETLRSLYKRQTL
ncbi:MAG: hypothetical protein HYV27_01750 [Candidatus Hydrogenedentes bacterium]|nr:hypothetical protein [Candidatus Hydrogenedentota bacterium]